MTVLVSRQTRAQTVGGPFVSREGRASIGRVVAGSKLGETVSAAQRGLRGCSRRGEERSDQHESRGWQPAESRSDRLVRPARICARAPHKAESLTGSPSSLVPSSRVDRPLATPVGHPSPATGPGCSHVLASRQPVHPGLHQPWRWWRVARGLHAPALPTGRT